MEHVTAAILNYLIKEAKKLGKKEADKWVHKQLKECAYNAYEVAQRMGKHVIRGLENMNKPNFETEMQEGCKSLHMDYDKHKKTCKKKREEGPMPCGFKVGDTCSQSNTPGTTQMTKHEGEEQKNMGGPVEEGLEQQVKRPRHIWRRFPNEETAALKWVYSNYFTDIASSGANEGFQPFGITNQQTTTALLSTGGGAWTAQKGTNILGNDGATITTSTGHDFTQPTLIQIRMTTPYNIMKTFNGTGLVGNTVGNAQPNWLELFDTKYQFYHVIECEWELTLNFGFPFWLNAGTATQLQNGQNIGYYIFWKYTSNDAPPTSYNVSNNNFANVNTDIKPNVTTDGTQVQSINAMTSGAKVVQCTPDDYFRMGGWHHKHVKLSSTHSQQVKLEGIYHFGQCKMDVKTQEPTTVSGNALQTEGWLQTGSTYTFPEDLSIIIVQDNAMCATTGVLTPCGFRFETEHIIQFRDLRSAFKFPTPANSYINTGSTLNTEAMFFSRGAAYS